MGRMKGYKDDIVHEGLLKVVGFFGGVTKAVQFLNKVEKLNGAKEVVITRSNFNNWLNRRSAIPYDCIIIIVSATKLNIEHFAPGNIANKTVDVFALKIPPLEILCENIILDTPYFLRDIDKDRSVIIDENCVVISGWSRIEDYKAKGITHIQVEVIDLGALYSNYQSLLNINDRFVSSERAVFAQRLNQLSESKQGQGNILQKNAKKDEKKINFGSNACRNCDRSREGAAFRKDEESAKLAGFQNKDAYYRTRCVSLRGIRALIRALDLNLISNYGAAKIARLPKEQQWEHLERYLLKNKGFQTIEQFKSTIQEYCNV